MNRRFINTGLRVLGAQDGSLMIVDKGRVKMSFHITAHMLERAVDDREAALMFRQLAAFFKRHHEITASPLEE